MHGPGPLGEGDKVDLHMTNYMPGLGVRLQNAELQWGKFYADGDPSHEISSQQVDETVIPQSAAAPADVWSCGRLDAASGSQGSFDLIDQNNGVKICTLDWNAPYEPEPGNENSVKAKELNGQYSVDIIGHYKRYEGTLNEVDVNISSTT